jgi:hypothetical protein
MPPTPVALWTEFDGWQMKRSYCKIKSLTLKTRRTAKHFLWIL